jgi:hypothetical protein
MPVGPNGEKRPADPVSAAVMVGRIATGQSEDPKPKRRAAGLARAEALTPERRSEIARNAARARWSRRKGKATEG